MFNQKHRIAAVLLPTALATVGLAASTEQANALEAHIYGGVNLTIPLDDDEPSFGVSGGVRIGDSVTDRIRVSGGSTSVESKTTTDNKWGAFVGAGYNFSGDEGLFTQFGVGYSFAPNAAMLGSINYSFSTEAIDPGFGVVATSTVSYKGRTE